jgi:hypothetical protein
MLRGILERAGFASFKLLKARPKNLTQLRFRVPARNAQRHQRNIFAQWRWVSKLGPQIPQQGYVGRKRAEVQYQMKKIRPGSEVDVDYEAAAAFGLKRPHP